MALIGIEVLLAVSGVVLFLFLCDKLLRLLRMRNLQDRYIVITGCDTGFGNLTAKKLDAMGCHVFAGCLTETGETELRKQTSDKLKTFHIDVTSETSVRKAFDFVKTNLPSGRGIWALVNNAGISGSPGPVEWLSMKDYHRVCDVNIFGVVDVTVTFLPLVKKEKGRVVNMSSIMGRFSLPGITPYAISKFGVEAFSDGLRRQLRPFKTSVHMIEPGYFSTNITDVEKVEPMVRRVWQEAPAEAKEEYGEEYLEQVIQKGVREFLSTTNDNVGLVVDAYVHAVTAVFPRPRYVVGLDAKIFWLPMSYLPEWASDLIITAGALSALPAACKK